MIRILLVDDQNLMRQGLQVLLDPLPELEVVGTAEDGKAALKQVEILRPDLVLLDIEMPLMNGIAVTHQISQNFPQTKVLVLSSYEKDEYVIEALQAGAKGYLLKQTLAEDLAQAIRSVDRGYSQLESRLLAKVVSGQSSLASQDRETQLLEEAVRDLEDVLSVPKSSPTQPKAISSGVSKASLDPIFNLSLTTEEKSPIEVESLSKSEALNLRIERKNIFSNRKWNYLYSKLSAIVEYLKITIDWIGNIYSFLFRRDRHF
jgi:DNA-binding NarL/FixJ family response regulator